MSRRRPLSDDDRAVWSGFTSSITPLRRLPVAAKPTPIHAEITTTPPRAAPRHDVAPPRTPPPPLSPFERRLKQRVARGREPIDARIDLHGKTQVEAHAALLRFLRRAQADGGRIALIVTGKGSGTQSDQRERGVLKRHVPMWLSLPEFRPLIVGFEDAHASHGGQGALYVRLRRAR